MDADFDPYQEWLGIDPNNGPPNHYQLLGLNNFESDAQAIRDAADHRMSQIRRFQTGPRGMRTQRILNELAAAKLCLLDVRMKVTYDAVIQGQTSALRDRDLDERWHADELLPPTVGGGEPTAAPPPPPVATKPNDSGPIVAPAIDAEPRLPARKPAKVHPPTSWWKHPIVMVVAATLVVAVIVFMITSFGSTTSDDPSAKNTMKKKPPVKNKQNTQTVVVRADSDGKILLEPKIATLHGENIALGSVANNDVITDWGKDASVSWDFETEKPGFFNVEMTYSTTASSVDSVFEVQIDDGQPKLPRIRESTGGLFVKDYTIIQIKKRGRHRLTIRPKEMTGEYLMTLRSVRIFKVGSD